MFRSFSFFFDPLVLLGHGVGISVVGCLECVVDDGGFDGFDCFAVISYLYLYTCLDPTQNY